MKKSLTVIIIFMIASLISLVIFINDRGPAPARNNEDFMPKDPSGNHYQHADELTTNAETAVTVPNDAISEDSNIGVQIIHDDWGYTLKDFYFSDTLPEGITKEDCRDFSLPETQPDENGVERWVSAADHIADDGSYDGAFGLDCVWLIVEMDIQNLTGEAKAVLFGSHDLHIVAGGKTYPDGYSEGAEWFNLHNNAGAVPEGVDEDEVNYFFAYFEPGETRTARFGWLIEKNFAGDDAVMWLDLDVWGYGSTSLDKVGRLYLR